ncbi:MAG: 6-phosphofructokinase [Firmicutes bacterium]|nr:6-phosphofructokinase [Bacillota bacterium]
MKIGLLTSGGDCQSLNAMMQSICKSIYLIDPECQIYGFIDGYQGLQHGEYNIYQCEDFFDLLYKGGTVLGTSRTSFKNIVKSKHVVDSMVNTYEKCELDCLLALGGNGSQKTSNLLSQRGCNVIALPKTIDNDLYLTDMTFGFLSAFESASNIMESIRTTATSHNRIFMVEIMGHKTGWLSLFTGLANQADMILLPEIPYDKKTVLNKIKHRDKYKPYIIVVAEGALSIEDSKLSRRDF